MEASRKSGISIDIIRLGKQCEENNQRQHGNITDTDVLADRSGNTILISLRTDRGYFTREPQVAANAMVTINGMPDTLRMILVMASARSPWCSSK